ARPVRLLVEPIAPRPRWPGAHEQRPAAHRSVRRPSLRLDALTFLGGDGDVVLAAAVTAPLTVPVLHDGQMAHRQRHEDLRRSFPPGGRSVSGRRNYSGHPQAAERFPGTGGPFE